MKLIYCPNCGDIRKMDYQKGSPRNLNNSNMCKCGASWGYYRQDGLHAVIGGETIPLGINNQDFVKALRLEKDRDLWNVRKEENPLGVRFEAFVIPMPCTTVEREGE